MDPKTELEIHQREEDPRGSYIDTYTGTKFYPTDPRVSEMFIDDIAHSLSLSCRFTGHVRVFYSVGEHCVRMAQEALDRFDNLKIAKQALMHDSSEAYLVDIPRPLKVVPQFGARYKTMEEKIMRVSSRRFGFKWPMFEEVRLLDEMLLNTEQRDLMPLAANESGPWFPEAGVLDRKIRPWSASATEEAFLVMYGELFER